jgi:hypothetical protein
VRANTTGWIDPGTLHRALVTGLKPSTRYYYAYGSQDFGFSEEASFVSPPPVGPDTTVKFLAMADMGQAEVDGSNEQEEMLASLNTTRLMTAEDDDKQLLIHNGDISYAKGYVSSWDVFFDQLAPLARSMPYMTIVGNHEFNWPGVGRAEFASHMSQNDSGGECGVAMTRRCYMPSKDEMKPWYSFDFGPIHFLQYSTEHDFYKGSEQHRFMLDDLASVDRKRTPWLIVGGHRPMVIDSNNTMEPDGDQPVAAALREALEEAYMKYKVDMTWHGHHHSYQRTCALYKGKCVEPNRDGSQAAPIHLVIGHAGAWLCLNVEQQQPDIFERVELEHGYMRVEANATHLHCEVVSDNDGRVMDAFTLTKPSHSVWDRLRWWVMRGWLSGGNERLHLQ